MCVWLVCLVRVNGVQDMGEDVLVLLSHATQERLRDVVEKLTEISQHRMQALKVRHLIREGGSFCPLWELS